MKQPTVTTNKPVTHALFRRCPGCFGWFQESNLIYYPPNLLDDHWDYYICAGCDHKIRRGSYGAVSGVMTNIGAYAGWSAEADKL